MKLNQINSVITNREKSNTMSDLIKIIITTAIMVGVAFWLAKSGWFDDNDFDG